MDSFTTEKVSDKTVKFTETMVNVSEISLESLYKFKGMLEAQLAIVNKKIEEAEKLGVMRGE